MQSAPAATKDLIPGTKDLFIGGNSFVRIAFIRWCTTTRLTIIGKIYSRHDNYNIVYTKGKVESGEGLTHAKDG